MTIDEYIEQIRSAWPAVHAPVGAALDELARREVEAAAARALRIADEAVAQHPASPELHCMRGELIQLCDVYPLCESLECFRRAAAIDAAYAYARELMGDFFDAIEDDPETAHAHYADAVALGAGSGAFIGLARTLAQLGRPAEALACLGPSSCPFAEDPEVVLAAREIEDGIWE